MPTPIFPPVLFTLQIIKVLLEDPFHEINIMACTAVEALNGEGNNSAWSS